MGKIKGWTRNKKHKGWSNDKDTNLLVLRNKEVWLSDIIDYEQGYGKLLFTGSTKKETLKFAIKYMRSHPNG